MSLDSLMAKKYDKQAYACGAFFIDAWEILTGKALPSGITNVLVPNGTLSFTQASLYFTPIPSPVSPCLVLFKGGTGILPHVGIYLNGKVLHLGLNGPVRQPLSIASLTFTKVSYYHVNCLDS